MGSIIKLLRPYKVEHWIFFSLFLFAIGNLIYSAVNTTFGNVFKIIACFIFIINLLIQAKGIPIKGFLGNIYFCFIIWTLILFIRVFFNLEFFDNMSPKIFIMSTFFTPDMMPYLIPLSLCLISPKSNLDLRYLINVSIFLAICYLIFYPLSYSSMMNYELDDTAYSGWGNGEEGSYGHWISTSTLGIVNILPAIIMIFFKRYLKEWQWCLFFITIIAELALSIYMARRGDTLINVLYIVICWLMYLYDKKGNRLGKIIGGFLIAFFAYLLFAQLEDSFFARIIDRGIVDTRKTVNFAFYLDMDGSEWIYGRGLFSRYYDIFFREYRDGVETGALTYIMRGGLLYLCMYVILLLFSGLKGLFRGQNLLVKSFGIVCLMNLLELYPFPESTFTLKYLIVWLGVYLCNIDKYLKMTDSEVYNLYFTPHKKMYL